MKRLSLVYLLLAAWVLPAYAYTGKGCDTNANKRFVKGRQPTADTLYAHIQRVDSGSWEGGFDKETFVYIGEVHTKSGKTYKVGHLKTTAWKTCVAFERLFIFDAKDKYLGQYAPVEANPKDIKIEGSKVIFPFHDGNILDLKDGPPAQVRLDGEFDQWLVASQQYPQE